MKYGNIEVNKKEADEGKFGNNPVIEEEWVIANRLNININYFIN